MQKKYNVLMEKTTEYHKVTILDADIEATETQARYFYLKREIVEGF